MSDVSDAPEGLLWCVSVRIIFATVIAIMVLRAIFNNFLVRDPER
jgi:hypothetical protein